MNTDALRMPPGLRPPTSQWRWPYRMVPARRGLKAYSQSCMSLSLPACSRMPRCSVHTANVWGVCKAPRCERHRPSLGSALSQGGGSKRGDPQAGGADRAAM